MRNWLRRWLRVDDRGTLTLLPDGHHILGLPGEWTDLQVAGLTSRLRAWQDHPEKPLILPFPVDVIDRRTP